MVPSSAPPEFVVMSTASSTARSARNRTFRDPVYGDIEVEAIPCAVVDTTVFQRLRYIRQNGLLHFVFPGATHTRFAHSIGSMWNATRLFDRLTAADSYGRVKKFDLPYSRLCFQLAALLHDVGHFAFSHSIERVRVSNEPFFPRLTKLCKAWSSGSDLPVLGITPENEAAVKAVWNRLAEPAITSSGTAPHEHVGTPQEEVGATHEEIGLLLIAFIFATSESVRKACRDNGYDPNVLGQDVIAILSPQGQCSTRLLVELQIWAKGHGCNDSSADSVLHVLHSCISGTLDVDRLDYLIRDSVFTGTCYGRCDVDLLLNALTVQRTNQGFRLCLRERAAEALDDMLWARFQLTQQVLNHKTNVLLNAMLTEAIPEALEVNEMPLKRPNTLNSYLTFTDDTVMSKVFSYCLSGQGKNRAFANALVHRRLPRYLDAID